MSDDMNEVKDELDRIREEANKTGGVFVNSTIVIGVVNKAIKLVSEATKPKLPRQPKPKTLITR